MHDNQKYYEKAISVGVNLDNEYFDIELEELNALAEACDIEVICTFTQNLDKINPSLYIGTGKVDELKEYIRDNEVDLVIFNNELSPSQLRNLQRIIDIPILDRTALILQIFSRRAKTKEAKLQVEFAKLKYMLPRLVGLHSSLGRQGGGSGLSNKGSGEKKLELDRRRIEDKLVELNKELNELEKSRNVQRKQRENSSIPLVSLVGYTNAGKSTILNALIDEFVKDEEKKVLEQDMLFATLETSVRKITVENRKTFLLSDTVGFVSQLPHGLVKAFRSTLEEVKNADLLIHVVDFSDENYLKNIEVTKNTLKEIGAENIPVIYVYNKSDLRHIKLPKVEKERIYMSASNKIGISELVDMICNKVFGEYINCSMLIPYEKSAILSYLVNNALINQMDYLEEGTLIKVSLNKKDYNKYKEYIEKEK